MHRVVVTVFAALLLVALGASLGVAKDETKEKRDVIAQVILLSGEARAGEKALARVLAHYQSPDYDEDRLNEKSREVVAELEREIKAEHYASHLAPLYEDSLTLEEARHLTELLRKPVLAKWVKLQQELERKREAYTDNWRHYLHREYANRFVDPR